MDCATWHHPLTRSRVASIQAIPRQIFEAARIDGVSTLRLLWNFMLALTRPAWMILAVLTFIASFEMFDLVYAMQGVTGSPFYSSDTPALLFYRPTSFPARTLIPGLLAIRSTSSRSGCDTSRSR